LDKKKLEDLFFYLFISVIFGGRLGYVIFYNLNFYIQNPFEIFKVWQGGMSFHGALIGIIITTIIFSIKKNISIFKLSDLLSITAPVGIFLGRISNFLNKELIGKPTEFFISVRYPNENFYRHISQIYEAVFEGLKFNLLSQGQLLSIPIVILGFYFLYLCQYKQR
jgi:phosphatidylglycerol:prolipoprotein diacylglycerol transferase